MNWKWWIGILGWVIVGVLVFRLTQFIPNTIKQIETPNSITTNNIHPILPKTNNESEIDNFNTEPVPAYVITVYNYIKLHNKPMENYVGGRQFKNREKQLPKTSNNKPIQYQEWDVHPKTKNTNRGAERIVTDNLGNAYFTNNHYQTFTKINIP